MLLNIGPYIITIDIEKILAKIYLSSKYESIIVVPKTNIVTSLELSIKKLFIKKNDVIKVSPKYIFLDLLVIFLFVDRYIKYINIGNKSNTTSNIII